MRLSAQEIAIERGGRRILSGVSFSARAGEALLLVGPNGSGKSSLLRAIAGFLPLAEGAFALEGGAPEAGIGEQAHYLGHADALKSALTAGENLAFWADALGGDSTRAAWMAALDQLGLAHVADFPVQALSAGQKTSRRRRSTSPPSAASPSSCAPISQPAVSSSPPPMRRSISTARRG